MNQTDELDAAIATTIAGELAVHEARPGAGLLRKLVKYPLWPGGFEIAYVVTIECGCAHGWGDETFARVVPIEHPELSPMNDGTVRTYIINISDITLLTDSEAKKVIEGLAPAVASQIEGAGR